MCHGVVSLDTHENVTLGLTCNLELQDRRLLVKPRVTNLAILTQLDGGMQRAGLHLLGAPEPFVGDGCHCLGHVEALGEAALR